ncbi:MAG: metalloregulator ArsR/SmtB family transcription factor [bacterium]|nr:metalloregulator ArsR/SmtB family transcription factor [bacterium]
MRRMVDVYDVYNEGMSANADMKRWALVFRVLANVNRLKIIRFLSDGNKKNVTDITRHLGISFKATSNHLALLKSVNVLEAEGATGHVFYSLNQPLPADFKRALSML